MQKTRPRYFKVSYRSTVQALRTPCGIKDAFSRKKKNLRSVLWDTGASSSAINASVAKKIGLKPTGQIKLRTAGGFTIADTFFVDLVLPNKMVMKCLNVAAANLGAETDMLIGMDVISQGNLIIENRGGITRFSFGLPSTWRPKKICRPPKKLKKL